MSDEPKQFTWNIEGSLPPTDDYKYRRNANMQVVASTLEVAVQATKDRHPGIVFHKVFRDRLLNDVIVVAEYESHCRCCGHGMGSCVCFGGQMTGADGVMVSMSCTPKDHGR